MESFNRSSFEYKLKYLSDPKNEDQLSLLETDFLSNSSSVEKVLLTSYPRSGNTLIRSYFEKITSVYTGSDCDVSRKLNKELLEMGMVGEGKINESVWIVKTHYPERIGHSEFKAHKCVVITRSPIDCISSLFNMIATGSHTESIPEEKFKDVKHIWEAFVNEEVQVWRDFHEFWTKSPQSIPTHLVRYEDLLIRPYDTLIDIFKFLLNQNDISNLRISSIIKQITDKERPEVYKPRVGKINSSKKYYAKYQLESMRKVAYQGIRRLGYLKMKAAVQNETGFISEDEDQEKPEDEESIDHLAWLKDFNGKMLQGAIKIREQYGDNYMDRVQITINQKEEIVRKKTKEDPTARGFRKYKVILRKYLSEK